MVRDPGDFVVAFTRAMHEAGAAAHRVEDTVVPLATALGLEARVFSTPTAQLVSFGPGATYLERVQPANVRLDRLAALEELAAAITAGEVNADAGDDELQRILTLKPRWPVSAQLVAAGIISAAVAVLFGGGPLELGAAALVGVGVGALERALAAAPTTARAFELIAALVAGLFAGGLALATELSASVVILAGLIILFPGYTLTVALAELVTRNLVSGTSRLMSALLTLLQLAVGAALADRVVSAFGAPVDAPTEAPPALLAVGAIVVAAAGLAVLFQLRLRALPGVLAACLLAFAGARLGAAWVGPELGVGLGAFGLTLFANTYARWSGRPAVVLLVPAILLLVPGSVGYRSMMALVHKETLTGIEIGVSMVLIAVSLVAAMTVANALVSPSRQALRSSADPK